MELNEIFEKRFSARKYSERIIERELLEQILDAGRIAPTAVNRQPQRFFVVESDEAKEKLDKVTPMRYGAPTVIICCADMDNLWYNKREEGYNSADMDVSIATTYMMLRATELGLGNVWVRAFNSSVVKEEFGFPENIKPICMLVLGYMADDCEPNKDMHFSRNNLEDEVKYL